MAASQTTNLGLNKPARGDFVSVMSDINNNMDLLDERIGDVPNTTSVQEEIDSLDEHIDDTDTNVAELSQNLEDTQDELNRTKSRVTAAENACKGYVANGDVQEGVAYFYNEDGDELFSITGVGGGGGGGGGGGSSVLTFAATDGVYAYTISNATSLVLSFTWSSIEDETPTGSGTFKLTIDGVVRFTKSVAQGTFTEDVTKYLKDGNNSLRFTMTDANGVMRNRTFTVSVMNLSVTSNFDDTDIYDGAITFTYVAQGDLEKTMHFLIDNVEVATDTFSTFGRQRSKVLPAQSHGSHRLVAYYTGTINGTAIESNRLVYDIICVESGQDAAIITTSYNVGTVDQYSTVKIPWMVYTPGSQVSNVTIAVNGTTVATLTGVDRTRQLFTTRLDTAGQNSISFTSGLTTKILLITATEVTINATAETEGLKLYLSSYGRSNQEQNPAVWTYGEGANQIACTFTGFNWTTDGWQLDEDGSTCLRVAGDARVSIPYKPFETDKRVTGFTIEVDFATREVMNYDSAIMSCLDGTRGFKLTSQKFSLASELSGIDMQFKENEHVRACFVVEKRTAMRLIYCYINGVMSGVVRYDTNDNFAQITPQTISIGSSDSTIDIYTIRIYDYDLPTRQVETNWIADTPNGTEMVERYLRNDIRDISGKVVINKLPADLPYFVIECQELPQYKGDKKTCSGYYVDPVNANKSFSFTGAQIDVQGTSSQYYERKNYKVKFNNGFVMTSTGETASKYKMRNDSIAVKTFCFKADVASSEGANNVELVRLYDSACPYKTPAQVGNENVRQGIDGFPMVIFWRDTENETISFLGKYNFNNDKSTADVFGLSGDDESWEIRNNTSDRVLWKSANYTGSDWLNDFEARFPDTDPPYEDPTQLKEFADWIVTTDPTTATGNALAQSVTYTDNGVSTTYTTDNAAYRKAKFRAELGDYVEINSCLFYYLFTELFLMVDSRAKNMFPSFMGSAIS